MSTQEAFLVTTAFLTLLPLAMVAGVGLWLRSRARRSEIGEGPSASADD